jgi:hypothetical protein
MAEYEVERGMPADAEIVFDVASDLERMDRWLPRDVRVEPVGPNQVRYHSDTAAPDSARRRGIVGVVGVDTDQLRVEWGSGDTPDYTGWLQVFHGGTGSSSALLHLSFRGGQPESRADSRAAHLVEHEMSVALDRLADEVGMRVSNGE